MNRVTLIRSLILPAACLIFPSALSAAPTVGNVAFLQRSDGAGATEIVVDYELSTPDGPATTTLLYSLDGAPFVAAPSVSGDAGPGQTTGSLQIKWAVGNDLPDTESSNLVVRVLAEDGQPIPLSISSTLPENSVTQTPTQTFTFTFGEAVTGFDASDVTVTGGAKDNFVQVSDTVYTLDVTGMGGMVTVSVAEGAATAASGTGNGNAADSYANFYQDTWTLVLQNSPTSVTMDLIRIPAGTFIMGSPVGELNRFSEETQHEVTLTQDFYLGKTEVTQAQWLAVYGSFPSGNQAHGYSDNLAVHRVSHDDIMDASTGYMKRLNDYIAATSQGPATATLPTESQWEYACRAGTTTRFNFGDGISTDEDCALGAGREDNMWYCGNNSPSGTKLVGQKPSNPWGLRDMHGNVWEWCSDWHGTYPTTPPTVIDPTGPPAGSYRVLRGGDWAFFVRGCRSAQRHKYDPTTRFNSLGFRVLATRPMPLTITSNETAPVHQTETQTLTFTFDNPVADFTEDDVQLTGATKGAFTPVSSTVYTLDVTATGGTITASVPPASPATVPATFSNFYQDTWTITLPGSVPMDLIRIPAGTFVMGSPVGELSRNTDETQHEVVLTQDFYLGKTEVTQPQWLAIYGSWPGTAPSSSYGVGDTYPAYYVSWNDIMDGSTGFMKKLNDHVTEPGTFTLPTESQWEYAARAGTTTRFNFGDGFSTDEDCATGGGREDYMWYCGNNSPSGSKAVGQKPANAWGLRDMHGNVFEWCSDWYGTYPTTPPTVMDPTGATSGLDRVIRSGGWDYYVRNCRSAYRDFYVPTYRGYDVGFRVLAVR